MNRVGVTSALVLAAIVLSAGAASAKGADRCAVRGSDTRAQNKFVRMYMSNTVLYGCVKRTGKTTALYRPGLRPNQFDGVGLVVVNRTRAAWVTSASCTICDSGGPDATVHTKDLRGGRGRSLPTIRDHSDNDLVGDAVDALTIDSCGRVAFRSVLASINPAEKQNPELSVWTADGRRVLDRGDIDRQSLKIRADAVSWLRAEGAFTAPVGGACFA
jgi:hypothetical protein